MLAAAGHATTHPAHGCSSLAAAAWRRVQCARTCAPVRAADSGGCFEAAFWVSIDPQVARTGVLPHGTPTPSRAALRCGHPRRHHPVDVAGPLPPAVYYGSVRPGNVAVAAPRWRPRHRPARHHRPGAIAALPLLPLHHPGIPRHVHRGHPLPPCPPRPAGNAAVRSRRGNLGETKTETP